MSEHWVVRWLDGTIERFYGYIKVADGVLTMYETDGTGHTRSTRCVPLALLAEWGTTR